MKGSKPPARWPKSVQVLTEEQEKVREDFMGYWLGILPKCYSLIEKFNQTYPLRTYSSGTRRTLELGAGLGAHLHVEPLENQEYIALELREDLARSIRDSFPAIQVIVGDCQKRIDFPDGYFDRVLAIHILEHLPNLPKALDEVRRVLRKGGFFSILIPCEGGFAYTMARNISTRRIFEKRYKQSYDWFIKCEHINQPHEIIAELRSRFRITHRAFFPFPVPSVSVNLLIGLTLTPLE